ncbi:hypothetical protein ACLOJK_038555 [Asimina triloba]
MRVWIFTSFSRRWSALGFSARAPRRCVESVVPGSLWKAKSDREVLVALRIIPAFVSSQLFPTKGHVPTTVVSSMEKWYVPTTVVRSMEKWHVPTTVVNSIEKVATKRFVFNAPKIAALRAGQTPKEPKSMSPSPVEAVAALI